MSPVKERLIPGKGMVSAIRSVRAGTPAVHSAKGLTALHFEKMLQETNLRV
jgi:hypothetical protein